MTRRPASLLDILIAMKLGNIMLHGDENVYVEAVERESGSGRTWNIRCRKSNGVQWVFFDEDDQPVLDIPV
jgi:hypothetical protein